MVDEVPAPPPPERPPKYMHEITFTSTSKVPKELRTNSSTFYLICHSLRLDFQPLKTLNHTYDYAMHTKNLLSSIITYDDSSHLLFRDESKDELGNMHPLTYQTYLLLETLQGLSTIDVISFA